MLYKLNCITTKLVKLYKLHCTTTKLVTLCKLQSPNTLARQNNAAFENTTLIDNWDDAEGYYSKWCHLVLGVIVNGVI